MYVYIGKLCAFCLPCPMEKCYALIWLQSHLINAHKSLLGNVGNRYDILILIRLCDA